MSQYAAIQFEVLGVQFSDTNGARDDLDADISFGVHSAPPTSASEAGGQVLQSSTDPQARFALPGTSRDLGEFGASFRTLREGYRFRNMGFLLYRTGQMVYFEDDPANPVGTFDAADSMRSGTVVGALTMRTKAAVRLTFRVGGVRLTLWREPETL